MPEKATYKVRCKDTVMARGAMTISSLQPGRVYEMADSIPFVAYDRKIYYSVLDEYGRNQLVPSEKFDILD